MPVPGAFSESTPRGLFGKHAADWLVRAGADRTLRLADGTVTAWDSPSGGTRYTDLLTEQGAPTDSITGRMGQYAFYGPPGVDDLWVDAGGGEREHLFSAEFRQRVREDRLAAAAARDEAVAAAANVEPLAGEISEQVGYVVGQPGPARDALRTATAEDFASSAAPVRAVTDALYDRRPNLRAALAQRFWVAHRGGGGGIWPEHSMEGYEAAVRAGFVIEVDLMELSDGTLVASHDPTTTRTMTGPTADITAMTRNDFLSREILPVVPGGRRGTPALWDDILGLYGGRVPIIAEVKTGTTAGRDNIINSVVHRGLQDSVFLLSFNFGVAQTAAEAGCSSGLIVEASAAHTPAQIKAAGIEFVCHSTAATLSQVAAWIAAGLKPMVYTTNDRAVAQTFRDAGCVNVFSLDPWWTSGRYPRSSRDGFTSRVGWIGHRTPTTGTPFTFREKRDGTTRLFVHNSEVPTFGQFGTIARGQSVSFRYRHLDAGTATTGVRFYLHTAAKTSPSEAESNFFLVIMRRNGAVAAFEKGTGAAVTLTPSSGTQTGFMPSVADNTDGGADHQIQVDLGTTTLTVRRVDTGASVVYPISVVAGTDFYLSLGTLNGGVAAEIFDILVT